MTNSERVKIYNRTKDGLVTKIYSTQNYNSKKRGHNQPTYTKQELKDWLFSQPLFHELYDNWKRLDYQKNYKPSVDRKDDFIGYTMSNIQLMTWKENKEKQFNGAKKAKGSLGEKKCKEVTQLTKKGKFIATYHSTMEAERQTGIASSSISEVCNGNRKTAGGYVFVYGNFTKG